MSINDCINKLKEAKIPVSDAQKQKLEAETKRLENIYRGQNKYPEAEIRARAEQDALEGLITRSNETKAYNAAQAKAIVRLKEHVKGHKRGIKNGLRSVLVPTDTASEQLSVDSLASGIYARATTNLGEFAETLRSKIPGGVDTYFRAHKTAVSDIVRALHGDTNVSDIAKNFAKEYDASRTLILSRLKRAGVAVNQLEDFGVSHRWDMVKLRRSSEDKWTETVLPRLDRSKMYDEAGNLLDDAQIEELVRKSYRDIIKNESSLGRTDFNPTSSHRKLHFKSGDAYLEAYEEFGAGDLYDGMMESLNDLSVDAALAEVFGPNPDLTFKELSKLVPDADDNALLNNKMIYDYLRGKGAGLGNPKVASAFSTVRNIQTASKLGSAALAAIGDQAFIKATANLWGMSYTKVAGRQIKDLFSTSKNPRLLATRLGQVLDWSHGISSAANRFSDINVAGKASSFAAHSADLTIRSSGLAKMTRSAKHAFGLELNSFLASNSNKAFKDLPEKVKAGLDVNGIRASDWDAIRASTIEIDGVKYIDPTKMSDDASVRFTSLIQNEARQAVPEPGAEVRALMTGGQAAGTASRELRSSFFQFGAFPATVMLNNWRRLLFHPANQGVMNKIKFSTNLAVYGTLAGAAALSLKDIKDGKELRDPTDANFWIESLTQAGTFGMGYLVPDDLETPPGGEVGQYFNYAPPVVRSLFQAGAVLTDTPRRIKQDKKPLKPIVDFATKHIPVDQWYTDLIKQRLFIDQLRKMSDPQSSRAFKRQETLLKKRTNQKYWWKPGKTRPENR
jgi:hypothetical protein